jgi:hypothetical protein
MANIKIAFLNQSTVLKDAEVEAVIRPLQKQLDQDFSPVWGVNADLAFYPKGQTLPAGMWQIVVLDDTTQAGDLGFHDLTKEGQPQAKVFARTILNDNSAWTVTASHELLEMLADPDINLTALFQQGLELTFYAYEVCDPCNLDAYGYQIDGVLVSDFVYPAWFESWRQKDSTQFDHQKLIHQPFQLLEKTQISTFDVSYGNGWIQQYPSTAQMDYRDRAPVGSRRERRRLPRGQWMKNTPRQNALLDGQATPN